MIRITTDKKVRQEMEQMMESHREREEFNQWHRDTMLRLHDLEKRVSRLEKSNKEDIWNRAE